MIEEQGYIEYSKEVVGYYVGSVREYVSDTYHYKLKT